VPTRSDILLPPPDALRDWFGEIDIYLFDQLLKGRILPGMAILDAGCGGGRNLLYLLRSGLDVSAVDSSVEAVEHVRALAARLAPALPPENFRAEPVEALSFPAASFDVVLSSAVLHFARDEEQFRAMLREMWRVLKPGGLLFARLASNIGIEERVELLEGRRHLLPDGSERFLVDEGFLLSLTRELGGVLADPLKTTNVQNLRCMTTWVVLNPHPPRMSQPRSI
jgi:SAM-dependent methyltransferase